jgi:hypothetical protein
LIGINAACRANASIHPIEGAQQPICSSNDMPICDPRGFDALGLVRFQINPHYLHGNPPGFKGETREERITEYLALHPDVQVAGLREGTAFRVENATIRLLGDVECRISRHGQPPRELSSGGDFSFPRRRAAGDLTSRKQARFSRRLAVNAGTPHTVYA